MYEYDDHVMIRVPTPWSWSKANQYNVKIKRRKVGIDIENSFLQALPAGQLLCVFSCKEADFEVLIKMNLPI